ncbi:hypothetical protein [Larkinella rosea]|uniref:Outer membrane protein beta-barrel domain-containing protein n=1 Tax=Larkinella rosea TaxID=2025312 RepID=A0A3P1C0Z8_9BACT|nr:hypothetical protein [Larkinella rosea]RRB07090.1 hypothetical protein EHT25_04725 [Larkinella rosea]
MNVFLHAGFYFLLTISATIQGLAQTKPLPQPTGNHPASLAIRVGLTQLYGDLKDPVSQFYGGASLSIPITKTIAVELPVDGGELQAQQEDFYHSIAKTRFIQVAAVGSVNVLEGFRELNKVYELRPYAGAGLIFFRAEAFDFKTGKLQRLTNNAGSHRSRDGIEARGKAGVKRTHELVYVMGLRGSTALSRRMSIFCDVRLNIVRTDKLDATLDNNNNVSVPGGPVFTEGNHYDSNTKDKWGYLCVGLNLYFGERFKTN